MGAFDRFYDKEKLIRKTIEIDNDLYAKEDKYFTMKRSLLIRESFTNGLIF